MEQKHIRTKKLIKQLGNIETNLFSKVNELFEFNEIVKRLKSLRKEIKWLKKQLGEMAKRDVKEIWHQVPFFGTAGIQTTPGLENVEQSIRKVFDLPKPVAEFKCAKTNKPTKNGSYPCIRQVPNGTPDWAICSYINGFWDNKHVIAFTETDPGEIVSCLNKEK